MNKLTKLGIVTFSAVTLSAVVPTLVHAEENVAPQPNVAAKPNVAQPTPATKPNGSWVDFSMLDPIAKPKPGKEVSKPAEKPVEEPASVEKPSTEGNILANGTDEAIAEDKKNAEIEKKYNVDPTNQLPEPGLPIITPEPEQPITDPEEMKRIVAEDLAYKNGAAKTQEERNKLIVEANEKLYAANGVDIDELIHRPIPGKPGAVQAVPDISARTYEIQADFLDADRVQKYGYTTESRIDSPKRAEVWSTWNAPDKDSADGILTAKKFSDYTFSHVVKSAADHPDIDPDPKVVRVSYDAAYALRGSGYKNGKGDNLFRYYFIYTKNKPVEEKPTPKDPQPAETEKPAEISKPVETVKPTEQPKPAENKPVENKPAETPVPTPKPAENPQPEVKPAEQPQPTKPVEPAEKPSEKPSASEKPANPAKPEVKPVEQPQSTKPVEPAENAGLPKISYRKDQPKRWFNGAGRPTLTTNDLAVPLPTENVEKTSYGWWTAEPDLLHAGSHIKVNTFNSNFNNPMFENGKEINFKDSGFKDMDSRFKPALVRVKVPELEGMNYEAYTIFYEVPNKNGKPTYGTNRTLQGGGISLTIKSKEKKEDIQVYTLTKDRKLEELYYLGFPSEETNRYDEKTKTHSYNLYGETYDTYVFLFKNPAEKPADQVKPEVKPSEQPKPDKQPSVPTVPADQPQPAKPDKPAEKPSEQPKPDKQPSVPTVPADQPHPTKPEKPAEKPSENPSASENPVNPANPAKPEVKPAEQPQENNIKSVRKWRLADGSFHEHPILTYADIVAPLPISDMKQTPINGIWTAEKDFVNNKPRLTLFWGSGNRYFEENGKEFSREELMKSTMYMYPIRVKIPELEGRNYEAYTIYTGISDKKTGHVELNKNTNITGEGYMVFRTKKEDNDVEVYQFSKNRQLAPLYSSRQLNERGRSVGEFGLSAEVYQTYVFLFKNPAEKPAEQVKPEVKPSEQPKPDKQPSVPTIPADQPQPTKPEKPAEKPSEQPVNPVTPVAPITPTTPVTPTLNPAIPNNTRVLSNKAGSVRVHGSEATLKNVSYIKVEETKPTSLESKDYKAFDIHLYDANGKAIQPNGMVLVSLSADKPVENVYYVAPDGTLQALKFKQDTDKVTFETNHFSIYAMTFKVAASRDNGGSTTPVPVVNSSNTLTTTEQKGNDASSTKAQAEPLATKTETISKQVAKTLPNTGENNSILATLFGMLTLTAGLFSFRKESE